MRVCSLYRQGDFAGISLSYVSFFSPQRSSAKEVSCLKLLSQRDYPLQSVLITTKCFQLVYTEKELECQSSS